MKTNRLLAGTLAFVLVTGLILPVYALPAPDTMYGSVARGSSVDPGALVTIDDTNGLQTFISDNINPDGLSGLAFDNSGRLFGVVVFGSGFTGGAFVEFNPDTGAIINTIPSVTRADGTNIKINDLTVDPTTDILYGIHSAQLYTINKNTGVATFVGILTDAGSGGLAFTPDGKLWLASSLVLSPRILELNPNTGATISITPLIRGYDAMGSRSDGTLFAAEGLFGSTTGGEIYIINPVGPFETFVGTDSRGISDIAFAPNVVVVGGEHLPIDSTALLLAGLQTSAIWMLPVLAGIAGTGFYLVKFRTNKE